MDRIVAHCGIVCTDCEAYVATQAGDMETLERLAEQARQEYGMEDATPAATMCDGCLGTPAHQIDYCASCQIRACAIERGHPNCAHCSDYACPKLDGFLGPAGKARAVLDQIRLSL